MMAYGGGPDAACGGLAALMRTRLTEFMTTGVTPINSEQPTFNLAGESRSRVSDHGNRPQEISGRFPGVSPQSITDQNRQDNTDSGCLPSRPQEVVMTWRNAHRFVAARSRISVMLAMLWLCASGSQSAAPKPIPPPTSRRLSPRFSASPTRTAKRPRGRLVPAPPTGNFYGTTVEAGAW